MLAPHPLALPPRFNPTRLSAGNEIPTDSTTPGCRPCFNPTRLSAGNEMADIAADKTVITMFQSNPAIRRE